MLSAGESQHVQISNRNPTRPSLTSKAPAACANCSFEFTKIHQHDHDVLFCGVQWKTFSIPRFRSHGFVLMTFFNFVTWRCFM